MGRNALGVSPLDDRPLTVTGGLGFAGGPVNNYPAHGIAAMLDRLRAQPGAIGLTTALGWYVTKHSMGVWSTTPPAVPFRCVDTQATVDAQPEREPAGLVDGTATVEATSVSFERDGTPSVGIVALLTDDGRRALANCRDPSALAEMISEPWEGRRAKLTNDGTTNTLVT